jgi:hypothetical protein
MRKQNPIRTSIHSDAEYPEIPFECISNPKQPIDRYVSGYKPKQLTSKSGVARENKTLSPLA